MNETEILRLDLLSSILLDVNSELSKLRTTLANAIKTMSVADLTRHPEGKWSTAEVLEHLWLTYSGTVKGCQRCLQSGKPLANARTLKQRLAVAVVVGMGYLPSGREAPKGTRPRGESAEKILAEIGPTIAELDVLMSQCESQYGTSTPVLDHPILGPLTTTQWRKFHWVHGRHHVKQILRLRGV